RRRGEGVSAALFRWREESSPRFFGCDASVHEQHKCLRADRRKGRGRKQSGGANSREGTNLARDRGFGSGGGRNRGAARRNSRPGPLVLSHSIPGGRDRRFKRPGYKPSASRRHRECAPAFGGTA